MPRLFSLLTTAFALALVACTTPDQPTQNVSLQLTLSLDGQMPVARTLDYTRADEGVLQRHTVRFYRSDGAGGWSSTHESEVVVTSGNSVSVNLKPERYKILAWSDYVRSANADWYWNVRDFTRIRIPDGTYQSGSDNKDAFCGTLELDLSSMGESASSTVAMKRPVGAFQLLATDKASFEGKNYQAVVSYPDPIPGAYNLWSGACQDTREKVSFVSPVEIRQDGTALIASDYLLMNGVSSSLPVNVKLQDASGNQILELDLTIDLVKGSRVVYKGDLMAAGASSGITVDPSFDGNYDIDF